MWSNFLQLRLSALLRFTPDVSLETTITTRSTHHKRQDASCFLRHSICERKSNFWICWVEIGFGPALWCSPQRSSGPSKRERKKKSFQSAPTLLTYSTPTSYMNPGVAQRAASNLSWTTKFTVVPPSWIWNLIRTCLCFLFLNIHLVPIVKNQHSSRSPPRVALWQYSFLHIYSVVRWLWRKSHTRQLLFPTLLYSHGFNPCRDCIPARKWMFSPQLEATREWLAAAEWNCSLLWLMCSWACQLSQHLKYKVMSDLSFYATFSLSLCSCFGSKRLSFSGDKLVLRSQTYLCCCVSAGVRSGWSRYHSAVRSGPVCISLNQSQSSCPVQSPACSMVRDSDGDICMSRRLH